MSHREIAQRLITTLSDRMADFDEEVGYPKFSDNHTNIRTHYLALKLPTHDRETPAWERQENAELARAKEIVDSVCEGYRKYIESVSVEPEDRAWISVCIRLRK